MITYHHIFDIYHTVYRILKISKGNKFSPIEKERLRLFDFLYVFPHDLKNVKVPSDARSLKNFVKENKFNILPNRKRVFTQTSKYFEASISCMLSYGLLDIEKYKHEIIAIKNIELAQKITGDKDNNNEIIDGLIKYFGNMPLREFKKRTDLIEYRYDLP